MTGEQIPHILVAIGDVQRAPKNALRKAAALAKASGASVELFHAIDVPDPRRRYPETATQEAAGGAADCDRGAEREAPRAICERFLVQRRQSELHGDLGSSCV